MALSDISYEGYQGLHHMHVTMREYCPCRCSYASNGLRVVQLRCAGRQPHMCEVTENLLQEKCASGMCVCCVRQLARHL